MKQEAESHDPYHGIVVECPKQCPWCEVEYKRFRTGFTFTEVRRQFWKNTPNREDWKRISRHTVLGRWREIKRTMWTDHIEQCKAF